MSIRIRQQACVGCKRCVEVCPGNLIKINAQGKADIRHVKDCWGCTSCLKECKAGAIDFFLGADVGGRGSTLSYSEKGYVATWKVTSKDGLEQTIVIDKQESNKY